MQISVQKMILRPRRVFQISRARRTQVENVLLTLENDGVTAYGEASPNEFYAETADAVIEKLCGLDPAGWRIETPEDIARIREETWPRLAPSRAAQCGLDVALWDYLGKKHGASTCELLWGHSPRPVQSMCTVGLSTPEELAGQLRELQGYPLIKLKAGSSPDPARIRQVRDATGARIVIDANCAWGELDVAGFSRELAELGVEFLEQPLPPNQVERMPEIRHKCAVPVFADENCVTVGDVPKLAGAFDGINIKLVKCGGITPARAMLRQAGELGLRTMIGCMLESSCLIAAGHALAQRTDYADLDGAWLLGDDPFAGLNWHQGELTLRDEALGLGVGPAPSQRPG